MPTWPASPAARSEEHTSELQSLRRISYAVFCLKKKKHQGRARVAPYPDTRTVDDLGNSASFCQANSRVESFVCVQLSWIYFFFFNETATTEIYTYWHTLSLHDALPISVLGVVQFLDLVAYLVVIVTFQAVAARSEEHTSELQSLRRISYAVFCLKK